MMQTNPKQMPTTKTPFLPTPLKWILAIATTLAIVALIAAAIMGRSEGQKQVEIQSRQQIGILTQHAIDLRSESRNQEALETYQNVLLLDPNNAAATEGIAEVEQILSGDTPDAQSIITSSLAEEQWAAAEAAFAEGNWSEAIQNVEQLRALNPNYNATQAQEMLADAYVGLAVEKEEDGQSEEALLLLDRALAIDPAAAEATELRTTIATYQDALTLAGIDWSRVVSLLTELERISPNYRDVPERLQTAHMEYGDSLVKERQWCDAAEQYNLAIDIEITPGSISKRDTYLARCQTTASQTARVTEPDSATETTSSTQAADETQTEDNNDSETTESSPTVISTTTITDSNTTGSNTEDADPSADPSPTAPSPTPTIAPTAIPTPEPAIAVSTTGRIFYSEQDSGDSRNRIFMHTFGSEKPTMLVEDASQPALRADGIRLAHRTLRNDAGGITSVDVGSGLKLRFTGFVEDSSPSWSPDGNRLVFASNRAGDRRWRIYTVWAEENGATADHAFGESPAWHPTRDQIAYRGCDDSGNRCGLWTMNGNGGDRTQLTDVPADSHPTWSPDGRYIVFMSNERHGNMDLYRVDISSQAVTRLTTNPSVDGIPTVSPDSTSVAFFTNRSGVWEIWAVSINGGTPRKLLSLTGTLGGNWLEHSLQWVR